jgi:hypothetical protein
VYIDFTSDALETLGDYPAAVKVPCIENYILAAQSDQAGDEGPVAQVSLDVIVCSATVAAKIGIGCFWELHSTNSNVLWLIAEGGRRFRHYDMWYTPVIVRVPDFH